MFKISEYIDGIYRKIAVKKFYKEKREKQTRIEDMSVIFDKTVVKRIIVKSAGETIYDSDIDGEIKRSLALALAEYHDSIKDAYRIHLENGNKTMECLTFNINATTRSIFPSKRAEELCLHACDKTN